MSVPEDMDRDGGRHRKMVETHSARFHSRELGIARAPGRVNLIGEHTDYNGLPVFPMAVDRDIAAVFAPRKDRQIILINTDPVFAERSFQIEESIPSYSTGDWGNYCKAAVQGLLDFFRQKRRSVDRFRGFEATFDGNIPSAAGMSSSSALVVLCALIFLAVNDLDLHTTVEGKLELADLLAGAEHYVGTQGGGMDQAISLMGRSGHAVKIDFFPLQIRPAPLPDDYSIVVADSTVKAAKTAEALDKYNRRPIECRLAAAVLKKTLSDRFGREVPVALLGDLNEHRLAVPEGEIWTIADAAFHEHPYHLEEIAAILGQKPEKTAHLYCQRRDGTIFPQPTEGFKLQQRYRHVIDEGRRVEQSVQALETGDIHGFGRLMNRSHESCRDLYEISCQELERLVQISREAGAVGSRLTGAGFGGCTVSLVENNRVESFVEHVIQAFYRHYLKRDDRDFGSLIFPCRAADGASIDRAGIRAEI
ncbi:MAG: galactokinase [Spirochaetaceae bacterium]|nr:MAG: galactokinase [Spirochaetaceae bacterium]